MNEPRHPTPRNSTERVARQERLAKALRDNLLRRKEQKRARDQRAVARSDHPAEEPDPPA
jgi:hypothetical protein